MHPFDIKTVLFAKHAQHVVLIHFPIALFIIGVVFDFLAQWTKRGLLSAAAYCNLFVAALPTIPVLVTEIIAWQWELEGQRLKGILFDAFGARLLIERPDLDGVAHSCATKTQAGSSFARIPPADRGCGRSQCDIDRSPGRVPQRRGWTGVEVFSAREERMDQKGRTDMKVTTMFAVAALPYAPLALKGNKAAYPNEKVVQFVVEKLDVTSLPSAIRPKKEKAKRTSADYGFTARSLDEYEAILEAPGGTRKFSIKILDQQSSESTSALRSPCKTVARQRRKVFSC